MAKAANYFRRIILGRAVAEDYFRPTRVTRRSAVPAFASPTLSTLAYAPQDILMTLSLGGVSALAFGLREAVLVGFVMLLVLAAYRKNMEAYPDGGGDYRVVSENLSGFWARIAASALLIDLVLTVALMLSLAGTYLAAAFPLLAGYETWLAVFLIVVASIVNLRGKRATGRLLALPIYLFLVAMVLLLAVGGLKAALGVPMRAPSAGLVLLPEGQYAGSLLSLAGVFLLLRGFASGVATISGVDATARIAPILTKPSLKTAQLAVVGLGVLTAGLLVSLMGLTRYVDLHFALHPETQLWLNGEPIGDRYHQLPLLNQLTSAVFPSSSVPTVLMSLIVISVMFLAAHTAFTSFPALTCTLATEGFLPRQLRFRGDRMAYSNGILTLAVAAILVVVIFQADVSRLIGFYLIGIFISAALSQVGMVKLWTARWRAEADRKRRQHYRLNRAMNFIGMIVTFIVAVVVTVTKSAEGGWMMLLFIVLLWLLMTGINRHYQRVNSELALTSNAVDRGLYPSRSHGIVLISELNKPAMLAVNFASVNHHSTLEALTVNTDMVDMDALIQKWRSEEIQLPLRVMYSPYREFVGPILHYVKALASRSPREVVVVYLPEFIVEHWWEAALHNHSMNRLKRHLSRLPRVMVASVPWQLGTQEKAND